MLTRAGVGAPFKLAAAPAEPEVNPSLLRKLKVDFGVEPNLPENGEGLDPDAVLEAFRAVLPEPRWKVLTDMHGMTLYTFAKDKKGMSACNGGCAANWPPLLVEAGEKGGKNYSEIKRADGKMQWAYKGHPLYTWKNDHKPGDITGDGFLGGAWKIAKP